MGSAILWWFGRRGADAQLVQKLGAERLERAKEAFRRWGGLALFVPALAPPPMPFKVFVLAAGVSGYPFRRFVVAVTAGRAVRYVFWAVLGVPLRRESPRLRSRAADSWTVANLGSVLVGDGARDRWRCSCWWLTVRGRVRNAEVRARTR